MDRVIPKPLWILTFSDWITCLIASRAAAWRSFAPTDRHLPGIRPESARHPQRWIATPPGTARDDG